MIRKRYKILRRLANVSDKTIAGDCIRTFVRTSGDKTDTQILTVVKEIKEQIKYKSSRNGMKSVLGSQFNFFKKLKIKECA